MTQAANFVHLHVHSEFSLSKGMLKVKDVVNTTAARGMPALALTDCNNLFALVKFYETCLSKGLNQFWVRRSWSVVLKQVAAAA